MAKPANGTMHAPKTPVEKAVASEINRLHVVSRAAEREALRELTPAAAVRVYWSTMAKVLRDS